MIQAKAAANYHMDKYHKDELGKYLGGKNIGAAANKEWSWLKKMLRLIKSKITRYFVDKIQDSKEKEEKLVRLIRFER